MKQTERLQQRLFSLKEAARYLGRPIGGVRTLIWAGKMPYLQDGRKIYIDLADMDAYIEHEKVKIV